MHTFWVGEGRGWGGPRGSLSPMLSFSSVGAPAKHCIRVRGVLLGCWGVAGMASKQPRRGGFSQPYTPYTPYISVVKCPWWAFFQPYTPYTSVVKCPWWLFPSAWTCPGGSLSPMHSLWVGEGRGWGGPGGSLSPMLSFFSVSAPAKHCIRVRGVLLGCWDAAGMLLGWYPSNQNRMDQPYTPYTPYTSVIKCPWWAFFQPYTPYTTIALPSMVAFFQWLDMSRG
jgi:hypothetical protein